RDRLVFRVERRAYRQAAFVQLLLAVLLVELAADLLGEILGGDDMRAGRGFRRDAERRLLRLVGVGLLDEAGLRHAVDDPVAALERALALAERIVIIRRLRQRRQIRRLRDGQLIHRLVEIGERGGGDAVGAEAEINLVE